MKVDGWVNYEMSASISSLFLCVKIKANFYMKNEKLFNNQGRGPADKVLHFKMLCLKF